MVVVANLNFLALWIIGGIGVLALMWLILYLIANYGAGYGRAYGRVEGVICMLRDVFSWIGNLLVSLFKGVASVFILIGVAVAGGVGLIKNWKEREEERTKEEEELRAKHTRVFRAE